MNDKYMTLFNKTDTQLEKELNRRGIKSYTNILRERAIAEIIYKDAFDAGRSLKVKENEEIKSEDYLIEDDYDNRKWKITLTSSQIRFLKWLDEYGLLSGGVCFQEFDKPNYEEVGRI